MDQTLSCDLQCNEVFKHIFKKFGFDEKIILFFTSIHYIFPIFPLVQSHIDYCITSWENCTIKYLGSIQKIQNRIARFLTQKYDYVLYIAQWYIKKLP